MNDELNERLDRLSERVERLERGWVTAPTLANPEPMPEWRALVDHQPGFASREPAAMLGVVLRLLSALAWRGEGAEYLSQSSDDVRDLARIIAICEAQVGDGWQADPSLWVARPDLLALLGYLSAGFHATDWRGLGGAAAAWLRDLTKADA